LRPAAGKPAAALLEELRAVSPPAKAQARVEAASTSGAIVMTLRPEPGT
jgi:hypothetical protein